MSSASEQSVLEVDVLEAGKGHIVMTRWFRVLSKRDWLVHAKIGPAGTGLSAPKTH